MAMRMMLLIGLALGSVLLSHTQREPGSVRTQVAPLIVQAPVRVPASLLSQMARKTDGEPGTTDALNPHDIDLLAAGCRHADCLGTAPAESMIDVRRTPPLTGGLTETTLDGLDPQIAASRTHLVVTNGGRITFFTKDGLQVSKDKFGETFDASFPTRDFFKPLWDPANPTNINTFLNLPAGAECQATTADIDGLPVGPFCLDSWYDTRVVFDEYRQRFWIAALARNQNTRKLYLWNDNTQKTMAPAFQLAARRTKVVMAVSLTDDPRDGWNMYWWNAVIADGTCTDPSVDSCPDTANQPGDGADYPAIGISPHRFIVANAVLRRDPDGTQSNNGVFENKWDPRYGLVTVMDADAFAAGCTGICGWFMWNIPHPNDHTTIIKGTIQPAQQHGPDPFAVMANIAGPDMIVWRIAGSQLFAPLEGIAFPLNSPLEGVVNSGQPPKGDITKPRPLYFSNISGDVLRAYYRNGFLHAVTEDCRIWEAVQTTCSASLRLVRASLQQYSSGIIPKDASYIERTFGLRNIFDDPPDEVVGYGNPGLAVNKHGDMLAVYNRVSPHIFPEARYSTFMTADPDIRPSALLRTGEFPAGGNDSGDGTPTSNVDTGGSGVDPFDDEGIWITQPYAYQGIKDGSDYGKMRLVFGKVYGILHPDLIVRVTNVVASARRGAQPAQFEAMFGVSNQGDGPALDVIGHVVLSPDLTIDSSDHLVSSFELPLVASGASLTVAVNVDVPATVPSGSYYVGARVSQAVRHGQPVPVPEYSTTNNVTFLKPGTKKVQHK
jgi:hypothetical protein